jgi:glycerol-3-phosphate cytidylyltransferase
VINLHSSIVDGAEAARQCAVWKAQGEDVVLTNGCFDLLHVGHARYLAAARALGRLIVGLNSDSSVRRLKGDGRPLVTAAERAELLAALRVVDLVTIFDELTAEVLLDTVRPTIYVKGGDYGDHGKPLPEAAVAHRIGARVEIIPLVEGRSTTSLVEAIRGTGR